MLFEIVNFGFLQHFSEAIKNRSFSTTKIQMLKQCTIHISQMYDFVFNEEEMKKREKMRKRRQEEKMCFHFFNCQVRTGCGF